MSANIGAARETARHVSAPPLLLRIFRKLFWEKPTRKGFSISSSGNLSAIALNVSKHLAVLRTAGMVNHLCDEARGCKADGQRPGRGRAVVRGDGAEPRVIDVHQ